MAAYRLIAGSHTSGIGVSLRNYSANDPQNNIVESSTDLATLYPERFVRHEGPVPRRGQKGVLVEVAPPGPADYSDPMATMGAGNTTPMSADEKRERAERLRKMAEELESSVESQDDEEGGNVEEVTKHVRESFARSDAASEFEEKGRQRTEKRQKMVDEIRRKQEAQQRRAMEQQQEEEATEDTFPQDEEGVEGEEASTESEVEGEEEAQEDDGLDSADISQLKKIAAKEGADVKRARTREQMVQAIRTKRQG